MRESVMNRKLFSPAPVTGLLLKTMSLVRQLLEKMSSSRRHFSLEVEVTFCCRIVELVLLLL